MALSQEQRDLLLSLRHRDPHTILGRHPSDKGSVIRVFRPDASTVSAHFPDEWPKPFASKGNGIFELEVPNGPLANAEWSLEFGFPSGSRYTTKDPYTFMPTVGAIDLHLFAQGKHQQLWQRFGARVITHQDVRGTAFSVWAPNVEAVSVVGDFNNWDGRIHPMRCLGASGVWELFIPGITDGEHYKFELRPRDGMPYLKADPFAFRTEVPPMTASIVSESRFGWNDQKWISARSDTHRRDRPLSIYEMHVESWARVPEQNNRPLSWRELAPRLADHVSRLGFTHVELMPIAEHPFGGSWGYQVSAYYAPTARFGTPDDFRFFVDHLHQRGIGVIVDWVPGHFPRDAFALARFDTTALYEHEDPRQGAHPDWGTLIFNFGRNEVRNFLVANALFWLQEFHLDGLRVDAVASMLYLDYSRKEGEWLPNAYGGRENLEAIAFLRELNQTVQQLHPDTLVLAEESTAWPGVSRPVHDGGLGFTHKWNMGWMHDTLSYFSKDPFFRKHHHHQLTFGLVYAFSENFVLPLSHDEVVHGKGSLLRKMPGDDWHRFANLRCLYAFMWAHPGKKLLFMGGEFGQWQEWGNERSLDWHLTQYPAHGKLEELVCRLNRVMRDHPALYERDFSADGFTWVQVDAADLNVYAFIRHARVSGREVLCVANLSPIVRGGYRVGVPGPGAWREILNTDHRDFGGSGIENPVVIADDIPWDGQKYSVVLTMPPLGVSWFTRG